MILEKSITEAKLVKLNGKELDVISDFGLNTNDKYILYDISNIVSHMSSRRFLSSHQYYRYFVENKKEKINENKFYKLILNDKHYFIFSDSEITKMLTEDQVRFVSFVPDCWEIPAMMFDKNGNLINFAESPSNGGNFRTLIMDLITNNIIEKESERILYSFSEFCHIKGVNIVNFSCACLSLLIYDNKTDTDLINSILEIQDCLTDGRIEIVDSLPEHKIYLKKYTKKNIPLGYRRTEYRHSKNTICYHRAGTVLIRDNETQICYLLGQDEGQYFGCELPSKDVNTVEEAFLDLVPEAFRNYRPKSYRRQGEWFVLNIDSEKPTNNQIEPEFEKFSKLNISILNDSVCNEGSYNICRSREGLKEVWCELRPQKLSTGLSIIDCDQFDLENRDSNSSRSSHSIENIAPFTCVHKRLALHEDKYYLVKIFEKSNPTWNKLILRHNKEEHEEIPLEYNTCYAICENRAVQSVSMQGVD